MLRAVRVEPTMVDQPAAAMLMNPQALRGYDALLLYDTPGLDFRAPRGERPGSVEPEPAFVTGFKALLAEGKGIVALHHALAGWAAWPAYAEALGGAFLYKADELRPSSGYAEPCDYRVRRVAEDHPVLSGMPESFSLHDELYLHELFAKKVTPLLHVTGGPARDAFQSAEWAVRRIAPGECEPWRPPAGGDLIGWTKAADRSPLVYLQPGDGPQTYANEHYRRLLSNALRWVASDDARSWAADQDG